MEKTIEFLKSFNCKMEITFIKVLEYCMIVNGIWKSRNERKLNWSQVLFNFIPVTYNLFACLYFAILNSKSLKLFSEAFLYFLACFFILSCWIIFITNRKQLNNICNTVEAQFYIHDTTNLGLIKSKALAKADKHVVVLTKFFFCMIVSTFFTLFIMTLLFGNGRKLLYPVWMPFDTDNNLHYLVLAYELIFYIHGILLTTSVCVLYIGLSTFYLTTLHPIGEIVQSIDKLTKTEKLYLKQNNKSNLIQNTVEHVIRKAIKQHIITCSFIQDVRPVLGNIFIALTVMIEISLCLAVFLTVQTTDADSIVGFIMIAGCLSIYAFLCCWYSEKFQDTNNYFHLTIYGCQWYKLSVHHQKSLLIVMTYLTKRTNISVLSFNKPSLRALLLILRSAYTYFNILLAISKKE